MEHHHRSVAAHLEQEMRTNHIPVARGTQPDRQDNSATSLRLEAVSASQGQRSGPSCMSSFVIVASISRLSPSSSAKAIPTSQASQTSDWYRPRLDYFDPAWMPIDQSDPNWIAAVNVQVRNSSPSSFVTAFKEHANDCQVNDSASTRNSDIVFDEVEEDTRASEQAVTTLTGKQVLKSLRRRESIWPFDLGRPAGSTIIRPRRIAAGNAAEVAAVIAAERAGLEEYRQEQARVVERMRRQVEKMSALELMLDEGNRDMQAFEWRSKVCEQEREVVKWKAVDWRQKAAGPGRDAVCLGPKNET